MWNTAETVLGRWTISIYTPPKLTNRICKKWSNLRIMGIRPLNVTKNRKVLWLVTWQFDYKKADFWLLGSSLFSELRTPSLVCPALSLSSFEVKMALPTADRCRLRLWGLRSISLPQGASHLIVQEAKMALPTADRGRLRLWGMRSISLPKGASHLIVQETRAGIPSKEYLFSSQN